MKKNVITLAFMLVFASTTVFADGELNHGTRTKEPEPKPTAVSTSNPTAISNTSDTLLNQVLNIIYALVA